MPRIAIEVQGHRGARGLLPENTLPSVEIALDLGVNSIETDIHLTQDDVPILFHDPRLNAEGMPLIRTLTARQLHEHSISNAAPNPLAEQYAAAHGFHPHGIPTLAELFDFVACYAASPEKSKAQRNGARQLIFDLELKRVPFEPETIGDGFTGTAPALLELQVLAAIRAADVLQRTRVRSFDHRSVWAIKQLEPTLETGLLVHQTAPKDIGTMMNGAGAQVYCPEYHFVDAQIVHQVHAAGLRIIPFTVNDPSEWERLIAWGVDGITTDYPDRLIEWLGSLARSASEECD
jgi:glycerophosphoryl diester phosphodiesterase